ncbi:hypothetical protein [Ralstonia syzygii]|uniref:hypothetical protein n=1 Tax=Ralstonia syzygii TaxID=28097 RepID=UPI0018D1950A|nr:hypothetical protein [Ralstonia syzygii]
MSNLESLTKSIFERYGNADVVGIAYFKQWSVELSAYDYFDLLLHQMSNYPHRYVLDFILGTPFLWESLGVDFWVKLVTSADRPDTGRANEQVGAFSDIEFLSRYAGVDALAYLWKMSGLTEPARASLLSYFRKYGYALVPSNLDDDDLDGDYFVEKQVLLALRDKLCREFGFQTSRVH